MMDGNGNLAVRLEIFFTSEYHNHHKILWVFVPGKLSPYYFLKLLGSNH